MKALLRPLWRRLPSRRRADLAVELLRPFLPKASNVPETTGPFYIVGYFSAPTGLGESARLFFRKRNGKRSMRGR
jgi:hypothetical protein